MTGKQRNIIIGALIVVLCALAYYFFYWIKTPQYSLNLIRDAVKTHNTEKFERHVDLDTLLNKGYDDVIAYYMKTEGKDLGGFQAIAVGAAQLVKPSVTAALKADILKSVSGDKEIGNDKSSGSLNKNQNNQQNQQNQLNNAVDKIANNNTEVKDISVIAKEADVSTVAITLFNKDLNKNFDLKLKMNKLENGEWRIKEITNLIELLEHIKEAEIARAKELDKTAKENIYKHVTGYLKEGSRNSSGGWFPTYTLSMTVDIKNITDKEVKNIKFFVKDFDGNGDFVKNVDFDMIPSIPANGTYSAKTTIKLNEFDAKDKKIITEDLRNHLVLVYVMSLETSDGTKIERPKEVYSENLYPDHAKENIKKRNEAQKKS